VVGGRARRDHDFSDRHGAEALSAGKVFQNRCASCHIIPDPAVATDRSWIDQVNRTS